MFNIVGKVRSNPLENLKGLIRGSTDESRTIFAKELLLTLADKINSGRGKYNNPVIKKVLADAISQPPFNDVYIGLSISEQKKVCNAADVEHIEIPQETAQDGRENRGTGSDRVDFVDDHTYSDANGYTKKYDPYDLADRGTVELSWGYKHNDHHTANRGGVELGASGDYLTPVSKNPAYQSNTGSDANGYTKEYDPYDLADRGTVELNWGNQERNANTYSHPQDNYSEPVKGPNGEAIPWTPVKSSSNV